MDEWSPYWLLSWCSIDLSDPRTLIELFPDDCQAFVVGRSKQAVVTDLVETFGENVLDEAANKFIGSETTGAGTFLRIIIAVDNVILPDFKKAAVAQSHAVNVPTEVIEDYFAASGRSRFAVGNPLFIPS